jgi:biopolymer transport protein ExbD
VRSPFRRQPEPEPIADVNVVPLADVSLVLLIILLTLSPMAAQAMLRLTAAAAKTEDRAPVPGEDPLQPAPPLPVLAVGLTPEGAFVEDGRVLAGTGALRAWLIPELRRRAPGPDRRVFLAPDLDATNGGVVAAIEALTACGASSVALVQAADAAPAGGR